MTGWVYDDGGREAAGFKGEAGDCVTRAIAIATGLPYREVYDALHARAKARRERRGITIGSASPRTGAQRKDYEPFLFDLGWLWIAHMRIGSGCTTHLTPDELPEEGIVICALSKHMATVIDGVVHDTHDPSRDGTRCVYGWYEPGAEAVTR